MRYTGELAALGTALCWATGSNFFAAAAAKMGSHVLNRLRITTAWLILSVAMYLTHGSPWPTWGSGWAILALAISGWIGFIFGDTWGFRAITILGPGRASLLTSTAPLFTTALAWPLLHQKPGPFAILGMLLTLSGTAFVFLGPSRYKRPAHAEGSIALGILAGLLGAVGQAGGYVLSKLALRTGLDPISATTVRVGSAAIVIWMIAAAEGQLGRTVGALKDPRSSAFMVGGAVMGPFLGVMLSLTALHYIEAGVAASITAVSPIFAMLIAWRFHNEPLTWRSLVGTVFAVAGIVVLFRR